MVKKGVFPGTFDPITYGHIDLIKRASRIFSEVIVAVADNTPKTTLFNLEERLEMAKLAVKDVKNVKVEAFSGLMIDYVKKKKTNVIIRGLRMISDFEYEFQMALTNRKLSSSVETIFMMPNESYSYVSSKLLKEAAFLGADLKAFIPQFIIKKIKVKIKERLRT
ncbi:MAG: pantetheine-phosphate adenylyltransferase [Candidatus Omnitrophota bacterium]